MNRILIEWDKDPDRIVLSFDGEPADLIVAMVNSLAELTRKVAKPGALCDVAITVSAEYSHRVFSENLTSVGFDVDGGEHQ